MHIAPLLQLCDQVDDPSAFRALCHAVELLPDPMGAVAAIDARLAGWSPLAREVPEGWRRTTWLSGQAAPWDSLVRTVGLHDHELESLLRGPRASSVSGISFRGPPGAGIGLTADPTTLQRVCQAHLPALRHLAFRGAARLNSGGLEQLLAAAWAPRVESLVSELGDHSVADVLRLQALPRLRRLGLPHCRPQVAEATAELVALEHLDLRGASLGTCRALELLAALPRLSHVDLRDCALEQATALVQASGHLRTLRLEHNRIGRTAALAMASAHHLDTRSRRHWQRLAERWAEVLTRVQSPDGDPVLRPLPALEPPWPHRGPVAVWFTVCGTRTQPGRALAVIGETAELGSWTRPVQLEPARWPVWTGRVVVAARRAPIEWKVVQVQEGRLTWEAGPNRTLVVRSDAPHFVESEWGG